MATIQHHGQKSKFYPQGLDSEQTYRSEQEASNFFESEVTLEVFDKIVFDLNNQPDWHENLRKAAKDKRAQQAAAKKAIKAPIVRGIKAGRERKRGAPAALAIEHEESLDLDA